MLFYINFFNDISTYNFNMDIKSRIFKCKQDTISEAILDSKSLLDEFKKVYKQLKQMLEDDSHHSDSLLAFFFTHW